uniref:Uncharacterized protein n=1 Tax=Aliivibrio wodanis TaxID=80852 RepID=A0A5Q4Z073_9GAMM|nr:hypothetical protein AW0309160_03955 [Aliivibrio wodanis]
MTFVLLSLSIIDNLLRFKVIPLPLIKWSIYYAGKPLKSKAKILISSYST